MRLNKELLIQKARESESFQELAEKMGVLCEVAEDRIEEVVEHFVYAVSELVPGIDRLLERCEVMRIMRECVDSGDTDGRLEARERLMDLTCEIVDLGLAEPVLFAGGPKRSRNREVQSSVAIQKPREKVLVASKRRKVNEETLSAKVVTELKQGEGGTSFSLLVSSLAGHERVAVKGNMVEELRQELDVAPSILCDALSKDILGKMVDVVSTDLRSKYFNRDVLVLYLRPGTFGVIDRGSVRLVTVHNGVLNHCKMSKHPTPYWVVMDVMSDLGKFTKDEVLERAVELYGGARNVTDYPSIDEYRRAIGVAYDVLKTHHRHPRKRYAGMSHMVEDCGAGTDRGKSIIRARKAEETLEFFERLKEERARLV